MLCYHADKSLAFLAIFLYSRNMLKIEEDEMAKITVFSKNNCMQCKMTKKFLEQNGAEFEEINIDEHPEKVDYVKSLGFTSAPVIEAGDLVFSGFQPAKLKEIV